MSFWTDTTLREPLRQNRWYITFSDPAIGGFLYALKECTKPEYKVETTEHTLINHVLRYPKKITWTPVTIKMLSATSGGGFNDVDGTKLSLAEVLFDNISAGGYKAPVSTDKAEANNDSRIDFSKNTLMAALGDGSKATIELVQVDANGYAIEKWTLYNCFATSINFGTLNYDNDGFVEITMVISYDAAKLESSSDLDNKGSQNEQYNIAEIKVTEGKKSVVGSPFFPNDTTEIFPSFVEPKKT